MAFSQSVHSLISILNPKINIAHKTGNHFSKTTNKIKGFLSERLLAKHFNFGEMSCMFPIG